MPLPLRRHRLTLSGIDTSVQDATTRRHIYSQQLATNCRQTSWRAALVAQTKWKQITLYQKNKEPLNGVGFTYTGVISFAKMSI